MSAKKSGAVIVVIGRQGAGKTPLAKKMMNESGFKNKVVFDRRKEYSDPDLTVFYNLDVFRQELEKMRGAFIVVEEATGFIAAYKDMALSDMMIGVEHNQNVVVFLFHSIMDVPQYIFRYSRFVVLLDTYDDHEEVKKSRKKMYPYLNLSKPVWIDSRKL